MINHEAAIIVTIATIMISLFGLIFEAQEVSAAKCINLTTGLPCHPRLATTNPAGANMTGATGNTAGSNTTGSNMTGASGIPTTHPAGAPDLSKFEIEPPVPSSKLCVSCHEIPKTRSASPAGLNTTSTSNATGSNATTHGTSIHTTNPADSRPIRIVHGSPGLPKVNLAGVNMTSTSNTTGPAGNTSAQSSSIPTTHPAGLSPTYPTLHPCPHGASGGNGYGGHCD